MNRIPNEKGDFTMKQRIILGAGILVLFMMASPVFATHIKVTDIKVKSGKAYTLGDGTVAPGKKYFIDRTHAFKTIPKEVEGTLFVMGANDDKNSKGADFLTFTVDQAVQLWICRDSRGDKIKGGVAPKWLTDGFDRSDLQVEVDGDANMGFFILYKAKKDSPKGVSVIGGNADEPAAGQGTNYVVLIKHAEGGAVAVQPKNKLATIWGQIKRR